MKITIGCRSGRCRLSVHGNGKSATTVVNLGRNKTRRQCVKKILRSLIESKEFDEKLLDVYRALFKK